jgi:hypothetical protein
LYTKLVTARKFALGGAGCIESDACDGEDAGTPEKQSLPRLNRQHDSLQWQESQMTTKLRNGNRSSKGDDGNASTNAPDK